MGEMGQENRPSEDAAASTDFTGTSPGADSSAPPESGTDGSGDGGVRAQAPDRDAVRDDAKGASGVLDRVIARFIDILIALLFARLPGYIGFFAALTYIGIADGFMGGRSIGKRIIGLRVFCPDKGMYADFRDSILRNSTIGLAFILAQIPVVGWALAAVGLAFELVLMVGNPEGRRLGDEIASTVVLKDPSPERAAVPRG